MIWTLEAYHKCRFLVVFSLHLLVPVLVDLRPLDNVFGIGNAILDRLRQHCLHLPLFGHHVAAHPGRPLRLLDGVGVGLQRVQAALVRFRLDVALEGVAVDEVFAATRIQRLRIRLNIS